MTRTPLLRIRALYAGFGLAEVLHGLDLDPEELGVVPVIGSNGAVKSAVANASRRASAELSRSAWRAGSTRRKKAGRWFA